MKYTHMRNNNDNNDKFRVTMWEINPRKTPSESYKFFLNQKLNREVCCTLGTYIATHNIKSIPMIQKKAHLS